MQLAEEKIQPFLHEDITDTINYLINRYFDIKLEQAEFTIGLLAVKLELKGFVLYPTTLYQIKETYEKHGWIIDINRRTLIFQVKNYYEMMEPST